jgi:hypothetical protein
MKALFLVAATLLAWSGFAGAAPNPAPPAQPVKLIFVHHSTGENLLRYDYGGLGIALKTNHYFVSDSNYGWGPNTIGDRTDIPDWMEWFRSEDTPAIMGALYGESGKHASYARLSPDPGGPNEVILFKSCFPNSNLAGNPDDPPSSDGWLTVGHAKWVYNEILRYFRLHPDKLFVVITAPPVQDPTFAANARAFNQWLVNDWLATNRYPFANVAVFDFYNVLTAPGAHHRYHASSEAIEHIVVGGQNTSAYASAFGDDHPNEAGSRKATAEFVPFLNVCYNAWKAADIPHTALYYSDAAKDGTLLESVETSGTGGSLDRTNVTFLVGDDDANRQFRGLLSFTLSLPPEAVITAATLKLKRHSITGTNPFTTHGPLGVDIRKDGFGTSASLAISDFQAPATRPGAASVKAAAANGWHAARMSMSSLPAIKANGITQFRLQFALIDRDWQADAIRFYSGNAAPADRPQLIVRYFD